MKETFLHSENGDRVAPMTEDVLELVRSIIDSLILVIQFKFTLTSHEPHGMIQMLRASCYGPHIVILI